MFHVSSLRKQPSKGKGQAIRRTFLLYLLSIPSVRTVLTLKTQIRGMPITKSYLHNLDNPTPRYLQVVL